MERKPNPSGRRPNSQVRPVHFEDFSGRDFERLVFAYVLRSGRTDAEWWGEAGGDHGRDIWCARTGRPTSVYLCANYRKLTLAKVGSDLERLADLKEKPTDVFVICGGTIPAGLREKIRERAKELGFRNVKTWSGRDLEEQIRLIASDLLARF